MKENRSLAAISQWRARHAGFAQFIQFALMGCITSAVDFGVFALCNFWLFRSLREVGFRWWLMDYSVANGGLCAFWAFAVSYGVSQTFNFFLQRKTTFRANNNVARSGAMYLVMVLSTYVLQLYLPTLIWTPVIAAFGQTLGDFVVKAVNSFVSMLIQFPINKYLVMRRTD